MRKRIRETSKGMLLIHDLVRSPLQRVQPMSNAEWRALLSRECVTAKHARWQRNLQEPPRENKSGVGRKSRVTQAPQFWEMLQWPRTPQPEQVIVGAVHSASRE